MTAPDPEVAERIARAVVEERLAACANVLGGVVSVYRWEGQVHRDPEALVILKTTAAAFPALEERVIELHPYEVPEVIALPVESGSGAYLDWIRAEVR